jgi:hypothetical protein
MGPPPTISLKRVGAGIDNSVLTREEFLGEVEGERSAKPDLYSVMCAQVDWD